MGQTPSVRTALGDTRRHVPGCQRVFWAECRGTLVSQNLLLPEFGECRLKDITPISVRSWVARLCQYRAPKTVRHCHALLWAMLSDADLAPSWAVVKFSVTFRCAPATEKANFASALEHKLFTSQPVLAGPGRLRVGQVRLKGFRGNACDAPLAHTRSGATARASDGVGTRTDVPV
jgi:hypothetical protein